MTESERASVAINPIMAAINFWRGPGKRTLATGKSKRDRCAWQSQRSLLRGRHRGPASRTGSIVPARTVRLCPNLTGVADGRPHGLEMRLFVTVNTARTSHSPIMTIGTSTFCRVRGDDDELQLSDQFQRVYADRRLCGAAARRRRRCAHRKALSATASRSGQQRPKSSVRTERADVADDRCLSTTQPLVCNEFQVVCMA